ncbi:hypothetical protein BKA65DRAFT_545592 [Rhexocercosporidium sp. MPI-PUGE-AT-0058]|nr:hypothetical protein BKA65DRAFT_545592 [Rhexocercosporidium sp. MPI-PUGE-AT-0058]
MKSFMNPSLLLAALSALAFTSAISPIVEQRQIIDTAPTVADCANTADCKNAAAWWNDCQRAHVIGQPFDPSPNLRSCLCPPGRTVPSHIDWYFKLRNCVVCVEMVVGTKDRAPPMYIQIEQIAGSPSSKVGFCHGTLSTEEFIQKMKDLVKAKNFPLSLLEAIIQPVGGEVARAATPIALSHPGFTKADVSSTPTALPNSVFSTFSAVPMESFLASLTSVTPTALPNSLFSTFSAVPMDSFLASISSATPTHSSQYHTMSSRTPIKNCNHDNCFRQALRSEPAVASFCATYTNAPNTASTGIPGCLSGCDHSPGRVSSACSCLASHASMLSNTLPASSQTSITKSSVPTAITSNPYFSTTNSATYHTSTTSCSTTSTHPTPFVSTVTSSSSTSSLSTSSLSTSSLSTSSLSTSSSSTVYPTANPTKWITFPASDAVKACAASRGCVNANTYYNTCLKGNNDEALWNCFCKKWPIAWKKNLGQCTQCLESALPRFAGNGLITNVTESNRQRYCDVTGPKAGAKPILISLGASLTQKYQSPLAMFNMTLVDAPYLVGNPLPSPVPAPLRWESLPASNEVVACSRSAECVRAGQIFNTCAAEEKKEGGNVKFCFCNTNKEWTSSLSACAACVAKNLPTSPPSTAVVNKDMVVKLVDLTTQIYCSASSQGSIERLQASGILITSNMQSPVKFFDMSLVTEPIPIPV